MWFKGTHLCNNDLHQNSISFMYMLHMFELCSKFRMPAVNTVGVVETLTVLQCDMVKISVPFKGTEAC